MVGMDMRREAMISVDGAVDARERKVEDARDLKRAKWTQTKGKEGMERDGSFLYKEDSKGKWKGASVTIGTGTDGHWH